MRTPDIAFNPTSGFWVTVMDSPHFFALAILGRGIFQLIPIRPTQKKAKIGHKAIASWGILAITACLCFLVNILVEHPSRFITRGRRTERKPSNVNKGVRLAECWEGALCVLLSRRIRCMDIRSSFKPQRSRHSTKSGPTNIQFIRRYRANVQT